MYQEYYKCLECKRIITFRFCCKCNSRLVKKINLNEITKVIV